MERKFILILLFQKEYIEGEALRLKNPLGADTQSYRTSLMSP